MMFNNLEQGLTMDSTHNDSCRQLPQGIVDCQPTGIFYLSVPDFPYFDHEQAYKKAIAGAAQIHDGMAPSFPTPLDSSTDDILIPT